MKHSDSIATLAAALAKAQAALEGAVKDSTNPHFKSRYADLASVVAALKAAFPANGLSYVQTIVTEANSVGVETMLLHASGEWILGEPFYVPVNKADAQGFGSALTYCRRYSLAAMGGVAPEDDDGNAATKAAPQPPVAQMVAAETAMSDEEIDFLRTHAEKIIALPLDQVGAYVTEQRFDNDEKIYLWTLLPSGVRAAIKKQTASGAALASQE